MAQASLTDIYNGIMQLVQQDAKISSIIGSSTFIVTGPQGPTGPTGPAGTNGISAIPPNYIAGLELTPATPNINIATGATTSDDATTFMVLSAGSFSKNANALWAVGSGNGSLDTGSSLASNSWYHAFLIERTDTSVVDALTSLSLSPSMPSPYTKKRRLGSFKTSSVGAVLGYTQINDDFIWTVAKGDVGTGNVSGASIAATQTLTTLVSVPPGVKTTAQITVAGESSSSTTNYLGFESPDGAQSFATLFDWQLVLSGGNYNAAELRVPTNTSQQIMIQASYAMTGAAAGGVWIWTRGWKDTRGK